MANRPRPLEPEADLAERSICDIAILALAQQCARTIPGFLKMLADLRGSGLRCVAFVGENGSRDDTAAVLSAAQDRGELTLVPTSFMAREPERLRRMALGRQCLKDALEASGLAPHWVCVADVDNALRRPPSLAAIRNALERLTNRNVFAVSATSTPSYYDLLAYEDPSVSFEGLQDDILQHRASLLKYHRFFKTYIYPWQRRLTSQRDIFCTSAFNGFCIYEAEAFSFGSYLDDTARRCEHVTFNRRVAAKTGLQMVVDPGLALLSPSDHCEQSFARFFLLRASKLLRQRLESADRLLGP